MKTATSRQLRHSFPTVLRRVRAGETLGITSRGKVVMVVSAPPAEAPAQNPWGDLDERFRNLPKVKGNITMAQIISEDREDRF